MIILDAIGNFGNGPRSDSQIIGRIENQVTAGLTTRAAGGTTITRSRSPAGDADPGCLARLGPGSRPGTGPPALPGPGAAPVAIESSRVTDIPPILVRASLRGDALSAGLHAF